MSSPNPIYRASVRTEFIPPCSVDTAFLKRLFEILSEINQRAARLEVESLVQEPEQSDEQFEELRNLALSLFKLKILVSGLKGEFFISESETIFDSPSFPHAVNKIVFDNAGEFNYRVKSNPKNFFKVEFDYMKPQIGDIDVNPSRPTLNNSTISVQGENEEWADWAFGKVKTFVESKKTSRGWLHRGYIYDLFLWFVIIPLSFWNLYKIDTYYASEIRSLSGVLQAALYLYAFIIILVVFRLIFNYARWAFPYMELESSAKTRATRHRIALTAILLSLVVVLIRDFIKYIIPKLF